MLYSYSEGLLMQAAAMNAKVAQTLPFLSQPTD